VNIANWAHDVQEHDQPAAASGILTIDLQALRRNYRRIAAAVAPAAAAAVVKANAYGLGALQVSRALLEEGCRHFFVAEFSEALHLRPHLPDDAALFVLNGLQPGNETACAANAITPVANSMEQLRNWCALALQNPATRFPLLLQFDTGMCRLGLQPGEWDDARERLAATPNAELLYVMSHLAAADEADSPLNGAQLGEMQRVAAAFPGTPVCFSNSGGVFLGEAYRGALVRPGIALYGGLQTTGVANPGEPVVSLEVAIVQTRTVPAGAHIGYGGAHIAKTEMKLATIAAGYADGLPRSLSDRGAAYFDGHRLPIVGRVSMDSTIIDVSSLPEGTLKLGTMVEILGAHQTIDDVALAAGTISYEILTSLGSRYRRRYC
jgi:alanine racemase